MPDFTTLADKVDDTTFQEVFKIIGGRQSGMTTDSATAIPMSPDDVTAIQALQLDRVRTNMALDGGFTTLPEVRKATAKMTTDAYFNPVNGIGTYGDPGYWNQADIPVSMSPMEVTGYYSSGGIAANIIDIKAGGMLVNGYRFIGNGWTPGDLEKLKEYADGLNFDQVVIRDPNRDALSYGGAIVVPRFRKDNALTSQMGIDELVAKGILAKGSLTGFWHADRWNCVLVPDYNIAASDYLTPKNIFVPIAGLTVNTDRAALLRPKMLPYWGAIRQMGWGVSEMEGWIKPLLGWEMSIAALPIMIQQQSVMYAHMPLDQQAATIGPNAVRALAENVQKQLVSMSNVAPKTFSSGWELKALERNYQGMPELVAIQERAVSAKAELSDAIIFNRAARGMNASNEEESTIKAAGSIQKIANKIIPQLQPLVKILIYSCFGPDSEQAKKADAVRVDFDSPTVLTNAERNEAGATFSAVVGAMGALGLQHADCLEIGKSFIPDIELPQDILDKLQGALDLSGELGAGEAVSALGDRLRVDAIGGLGERLRDEAGVTNLRQKVSSGDTSGRKPEMLAGSPVGLLSQRLRGLFSKQTIDSLTWSGFKLQGRTKVHGMDISIENKKGSTRKGTDKDGHEWATKMNFDYGYIRGTVGKDKDHLDVYLGPNLKSEKVFVVHQNDPVTGKYDEDKVMLGFDSDEDAKAGYMKQYDRPGFFGDMVSMGIDEFKKKIFDDKNKGKRISTDSDFVESEHPRDADGKFGSGGGGSAISNRQDQAVVNIPLSKRGDIDAQIDRWKADQEKIKRKEMKEIQATFKSNKELAKTLYQERGQELMDQLKTKFSEKQLKEIFDGWLKDEPNKMILAISKLDKGKVLND